MNKKSILVLGTSGSGKTNSLRNLDLETTLLLNTDGKSDTVVDPDGKLKVRVPETAMEVIDLLETIEESKYETIVVDTLSFWIQQLEQELTYDVDDSRGGWNDFAMAIKKLLTFANNKSKKNWIFLSHVSESTLGSYDVPVKGSIKNIGISAWFSTVIYMDTFDVATETILGSAVGYKMFTKPTMAQRKLPAKSPLGAFPAEIKNNDLDLIVRALNGEKIDWNDDDVIFEKDKLLAKKLGL